jgi:hypothetical protein
MRSTGPEVARRGGIRAETTTGRAHVIMLASPRHFRCTKSASESDVATTTATGCKCVHFLPSRPSTNLWCMCVRDREFFGARCCAWGAWDGVSGADVEHRKNWPHQVRIAKLYVAYLTS